MKHPLTFNGKTPIRSIVRNLVWHVTFLLAWVKRSETREAEAMKRIDSLERIIERHVDKFKQMEGGQ